MTSEHDSDDAPELDLSEFPFDDTPLTAPGGLDEAIGPDQHGPDRWQLNRAGIINVYQYENEVLHFSGGRLLLRGVNGSGKSTAMNMLLPFLLTARQRGIDAAAEQTSILASWMLSGRDEPQPVGYLWIEFRRGDEYFVCGAGIRASQSTRRVTTWWFITDRRPGIDLALVERNAPLSVDALRNAVGSDAVFLDDRRRDYRQTIARRLFGGADLDQHLRLLNIVRSPRVGDRVDQDVPQYLVDALPALSEQAVAEAARPLEDLDQHRDNVAGLEATVEALDGIATVYRRYAVAELHRFAAEGQVLVDTARSHQRDETRLERRARQAGDRAEQAKTEIERLESDRARLSTEIDALKSSDAYVEGRQLEDLRSLVTNLSAQLTRLQRHHDALAGRAVTDRQAVARAEAGADHEAGALSDDLVTLAAMAAEVHLAARPPSVAPIERTALTGPSGGGGSGAEAAGSDTPIAEPNQTFDQEPIRRGLAAVQGSTQVRAGEVAEVKKLLAAVDEALVRLTAAEADRGHRLDDVEDAGQAFSTARTALREAGTTWDQSVVEWARGAWPMLAETDVPAVAVNTLVSTAVDDPTAGADGDAKHGRSDHTGTDAPTAGPEGGGDRPGAGPDPDPGNDVPLGDRPALRQVLAEESGRLVLHRQRLLARVEVIETDAASEVARTATIVEDLAARSEPDPPSLWWQQDRSHSLADLIDFAPDVNPEDQAGLEAALEASGLLAASVVTAGDPATGVQQPGLRLETGELVLVPSTDAEAGHGGEARALSRLVTVVVPEGSDVDPSHVSLVLDSISTDFNGSSPTVAAVDGSFRVGALNGRHGKDRAEHIGVTARRAALERLRAEAAVALAEAEAALGAARGRRAAAEAGLTEAAALNERLPSLDPVDRAQVRSEQAEDHLNSARVKLAESEREVASADQVHAEWANERDRVANTHQLPGDAEGLRLTETTLAEINHSCRHAQQRAQSLVQSSSQWINTVERWQEGVAELTTAQAELTRGRDDHQQQASKLATLEDTTGLPYQEVLASITMAESELTLVVDGVAPARAERESAINEQAQARAEATNALSRRRASEAAGVRGLERLGQALAVPGLVAAIVDDEDDGTSTVLAPPDISVDGLGHVVDQLLALLPPADPNDAGADGVRRSLRARRDSLGAGWDAEDRQPDPSLPLSIQVNGPQGKMVLVNALSSSRHSLAGLAALLTQKQDQALRQLLQGLVAREVAEKLDGALRLVAGMNDRLTGVTTAHGIGVELRWRRAAELDQATVRMVELLAKLPDLRTIDEDAELQQSLSARLSEARRAQPDASYQHLIAEVLDYRQWYDMAVLVRRGDDATPTKLNRRTALSEGEKKLVTYLPLFAAVAASCDALAGYQEGVPRFVMLDDAFAKVSEDNHAALFGLLVKLDLDVIATSERLWGTHASVPQLAITEVIRDAELGAILLEHSHWDGVNLTRSGSSGIGIGQ